MWQARAPLGPKTDLQALHLNAERAGWAFCCPFSSSDEFETAVIKSRLRAGAYGPRRRRRHAICAIAIAGAIAMALLAI